MAWFGGRATPKSEPVVSGGDASELMQLPSADMTETTFDCQSPVYPEFWRYNGPHGQYTSLRAGEAIAFEEGLKNINR